MDLDEEPTNSFAGHPSCAGLAAHYELDLTCRGEADVKTGYFLNIRDIDRAGRDIAIPLIARAFRAGSAHPECILHDLLETIGHHLPSVCRARWRLTPTYSIEMERFDMTAVLLRQRFEFAAAHRLHVPTLSDADNRAIFGACNNPAGHGHNYQVEPCVRVPLAPGAPTFSLRDLERLTRSELIDHLDHTHLNHDVPEFASLNPSVENIARVCFDRLAPAIRSAGAELTRVTVWETEKTSCSYPA